MLLEQAIRPFLLTQTPVTDLVSDRIFAETRPEGSPLPAVSFFEVSGNRVESHDGPSRLAGPIYQFSCWASGPKGYVDAAEVRQAVENAWTALGRHQAIGPGDGVRILGTVFVGSGRDFEVDTDIYHAWVRRRIWHRES